MLLKDKITMYLKPTEACNLNCLHCYNQKNNTKSALNIISFKHFLDSMADRLSNRELFLDIVFHGGEPTLVGVDKLEAFCNLIQSRFVLADLKFSIQTNLTRVDDKFIQFARDRLGGHVGTSYSPYLRFMGNYAMQEVVWEKNLRRLKDADIDLYLVVTLSKEYIKRTRPQQLINFLVERGFYGFHFEPITKDGNAQGNWNDIAPTPEEYDHWKSEFARLFIDSGAYLMFSESEILRKAKSHYDGAFVGCSCRDCMLTTMTINGDGTVGLCPNNSKTYLICNLYDDFKKFLDSNLRKSLVIEERSRRQECLDCEHFQMCNGGCMQTMECYEGKNYFRVLKEALIENKNFAKYVRNYERNKHYCSTTTQSV